MREDSDFQPTKLDDGTLVYTNLEKACEGLPEWNDMLWCTFCRKPITTMKDINFFRWDNGKELWFKVFHESCYYSSDKATPVEDFKE